MVYVVWFKKDLRWHDHAPLANAAAWAASGASKTDAVLPLWIYEPAMWQQPDAAVQHLGFANECLSELSNWVQHDATGTDSHHEVRDEGNPSNHPGLCRLHGDMLSVLKMVLAQLGSFILVSHEEIGNSWSYQRDLDVAAWCAANGVEWREFASNGVVRRLHALGGRNRWSAHHKQRMESGLLAAPQGVRWVDAAAMRRLPLCGEMGADELGMLGIHDAQGTQGTQNIKDAPDKLKLLNIKSQPDALAFKNLQDTPHNNSQDSHQDKPLRKPGGRSQALLELLSFLERRGQYYRFEMSSPVTAPESCSRISAHLAWGTLSVRECIKAVATQRSRLMQLPAADRPESFLQSLKSFEGRLHWHCHFIQKLESEPAIEHRNVNRGFEIGRAHV